MSYHPKFKITLKGTAYNFDGAHCFCCGLMHNREWDAVPKWCMVHQSDSDSWHVYVGGRWLPLDKPAEPIAQYDSKLRFFGPEPPAGVKTDQDSKNGLLQSHLEKRPDEWRDDQ